MTQSKQEIPHFYVQAEVAVDGLRERIDVLSAPGGQKVTMTYALVRACVESLRGHPRFNSVWTPEGLLAVSPINLGVAIAVDDGLLAPALLGARNLDHRRWRSLRDLVERARTSRLRPEMTEATFTLSNLGMFDVSAFTAIVAPPQVAILAVVGPAAMCRSKTASS